MYLYMLETGELLLSIVLKRWNLFALQIKFFYYIY